MIQILRHSNYLFNQYSVRYRHVIHSPRILILVQIFILTGDAPDVQSKEEPNSESGSFTKLLASQESSPIAALEQPQEDSTQVLEQPQEDSTQVLEQPQEDSTQVLVEPQEDSQVRSEQEVHRDTTPGIRTLKCNSEPLKLNYCITLINDRV